MELAETIADIGSTLGTDEAGYLVGRIYAAMLPDEMRSEFGIYYTPPLLAGRLLDLAEAAGTDWRTARVLDPACGGGAFLGPVARRMIRHMHGADRRIVLRNLATRLRGYEIDPFAAWLSAVFLDATLIDEIGGRGDEGFMPIETCNALEQHANTYEFDLVVGNPPYGRVRLDPRLRAAFRRSLFGHANLYGLFLDLALRHCRDQATIALVTPTSFLSGEYFKNLRSMLATSAPPQSLDFISRRAGIFDDVLQETILAVFSVGKRARCTEVRFLDVSSSAIVISETDRIPVPASATPWIVPRTTASTKLATKLRSMPTRLADWGYRVSTGPLVWNRFKDRLRAQPCANSIPLIWAESVAADGKFEFRAARRNHAPYFIARPDEEFLLIRNPCVLLQRTTAKEQSRRLFAAELPQSFIDTHGAVTVENHLNMLVSDGRPAVSPRVLASFLNSLAADAAFRCISGSVAVSAYELEAMPLPTIDALKPVAKAIAERRSAADIEKAWLRLYEDE